MNLKQASNRARTLMLIGASIWLLAALLYFVGALRGTYQSAERLLHSPLAPFGHLIKSLIAQIYEAGTPLTSSAWRVAPVSDFYNVFSLGNIQLLGCLGFIMIGQQIFKEGSKLRKRVKMQLERYEESQWTPSPGGAALSVGTMNTVVYNEYVPGPGGDQKWWTKPWGITALSILASYIAALLSYISGF